MEVEPQKIPYYPLYALCTVELRMVANRVMAGQWAIESMSIDMGRAIH